MVATVRVLVAESCRPLADVVAEGLSNQGIAADFAYDGPEAASKLGVNRYEVAVQDRGLPGIPGDICAVSSLSPARG